ncbi:MAG: CRISPR-associated endonuclease Cas2 [Bacteroidota bacterium]
MWILVLFDLPTDTKAARKRYIHFRKGLLEDGFSMMQYSVYYRHCASRENLAVHSERVALMVPADGEVRVMSMTDKQFETMQVFYGKKRGKIEKPPAQLEFF